MKKYDLLDFYPKFDTKNNKQQKGFHACLFGEKKLQSHSETKEKSYTNKYGYVSYTLAIRGSFDSKDYVEADFWHLLINSTIPFDYYNDMLNFYEQCIEKYPNLKQSKSLNIVGHSLGGALAQMLTLSLCDNANEANINEVYTFNSPGAKDLKPNIDLKLDGELYYVDSDIINSPNPAQMLFDKIMGNKTDMNIILRAIYEVGNAYYRTEKELLSALQIYFSNIPQNNRQPHQIFLYRYTSYQYRYNAIKYKVYKASSMFVENYNTLKHNYENRNNYKLSVSNRVFHIETDGDSNPDNNQWQDELIQNLGTDIDGKHYYVNIGIGLKGTQYITKIGKGWFESHSLIPLTQTLYFYSYLLELDSNYNKVKDKSFSECIEYLNTFNKNLETYTNTFILAKINKGNKTQYNLNTLQSSPIFVVAAINNLFGEAPEEIWYLSFILSLINSKIYNTIALRQDENKYNHPTIPKESIIDFITTLSNDGYYISILDEEYFAKIRKECDYINDINNVGYKACLAEYRNFIIINKNNQTIENKDNLGSIYGYDSSVYRAVHNRWCETSLGSHCKIIQGLYYGGKATMIAVKGA